MDYKPTKTLMECMYITASTDANSIVAIIKDALMRMNWSLAQCRGQCYDGAAVMQGCRNGVAVQILQVECPPLIVTAIL